MDGQQNPGARQFAVPDVDDLEFGEFDPREGGSAELDTAPPIQPETAKRELRRVNPAPVDRSAASQSTVHQPTEPTVDPDLSSVQDEPSGPFDPADPVSQGRERPRNGSTGTRPRTRLGPVPASDVEGDGYPEEAVGVPRNEPRWRRRAPVSPPVEETDPGDGYEDDGALPEGDGYDEQGYDDGYDENYPDDHEYGPEYEHEDDTPDEYADEYADDEFHEDIDQSDYEPPRRRGRIKGRSAPRTKGKSKGRDNAPIYNAPTKPAGHRKGLFGGRPAPKKKTKGKEAKEKDHKVAFAGGRSKLLFLRWLVFAGLGLIVLAGMRAVFLPTNGPDEADIQAMVASELSHGGFPADSGAAFALMCADAFLSYDQVNRDARGDEMEKCTTSSDSFVGWNGRGDQGVVAGPFMAAPPEVRDKNNAFFTVAAKVVNGGWIYLSIPVYADANGKFAMAGVPALVPPPALASPPGGAGISKNDNEAQEALELMLPGFFAAWGASDANSLDRYVTRDANPNTLIGLGGSVELLKVDAVRVPEAEGASTRTAEVDVVWSVEDGGEWEQSYRVTVVSADGSWYVKSVDGATSLAGTEDDDTGDEPAGDEADE